MSQDFKHALLAAAVLIAWFIAVHQLEVSEFKHTKDVVHGSVEVKR